MQQKTTYYLDHLVSTIKMMKVIAPILLLFLSSSMSGQQNDIDSLKTLLNSEVKKEEKLKILNSLNKLLIFSSSPNESTLYFKKMGDLAKEFDDSDSEREAYRYLARNYIRLQEFENSEKYALKAVSISESANDTDNYLEDINVLAKVYHDFKKFNQAIETYKKGIERYHKNPKGKGIAKTYSNLGVAYGKIDEQEKQINSLIKASEIAEEIKDYKALVHSLYAIAMFYNSVGQYKKADKYLLDAFDYSSQINEEHKYMLHHGIAINYADWGKYDQALKHNLIALEYYSKIGNKLYEFDVLNNISVLFNKWEKPIKALNYGKKALIIAKEIKHKLAIFATKNNLAEAYISLNDLDKAEVYLVEITKDSNYRKELNAERIMKLYQNFVIVHEGKKEYKIANNYLKKIKELNDSVSTLERDTKIADIETKYQTEKKEKENLQLKQEKSTQLLKIEKENRYKWLFGIGMVWAIVVLLIFAYYAYKMKKQKETIEVIQKELHHRVKNNLAVIDSFIEVAKDDLPDEKIASILNELQNRIMSINEVHKQLHKSEDISKLSLKEYVKTITNNIQTSFNEPLIVVKQQIDKGVYLPADQSFSVGLIINEFLTNSFKYGFPDDKGIIKIDLKEKNDKYFLTLEDNGIGLPDDFNVSAVESFGMRVLGLLTQQINGAFNFKSEQGVQLNIKFPKK